MPLKPRRLQDQGDSAQEELPDHVPTALLWVHQLKRQDQYLLDTVRALDERAVQLEASIERVKSHLSTAEDAAKRATSVATAATKSTLAAQVQARSAHLTSERLELRIQQLEAKLQDAASNAQKTTDTQLAQHRQFAQRLGELERSAHDSRTQVETLQREVDVLKQSRCRDAASPEKLANAESLQLSRPAAQQAPNVVPEVEDSFMLEESEAVISSSSPRSLFASPVGLGAALQRTPIPVSRATTTSQQSMRNTSEQVSNDLGFQSQYNENASFVPGTESCERRLAMQVTGPDLTESGTMRRPVTLATAPASYSCSDSQPHTWTSSPPPGNPQALEGTARKPQNEPASTMVPPSLDLGRLDEPIAQARMPHRSHKRKRPVGPAPIPRVTRSQSHVSMCGKGYLDDPEILLKGSQRPRDNGERRVPMINKAQAAPALRPQTRVVPELEASWTRQPPGIDIGRSPIVFRAIPKSKAPDVHTVDPTGLNGHSNAPDQAVDRAEPGRSPRAAGLMPPPRHPVPALTFTNRKRLLKSTPELLPQGQFQ